MQLKASRPKYDTIRYDNIYVLICMVIGDV